ncbi:MAG: hypothetical protein MZW92_71810 [Comamonadaceae bacterium]|nr:hypothetical protein [Comamonadaceae bacterium]
MEQDVPEASIRMQKGDSSVKLGIEAGGGQGPVRVDGNLAAGFLRKAIVHVAGNVRVAQSILDLRGSRIGGYMVSCSVIRGSKVLSK